MPTFAQLVLESRAAGMARREAEAHARKILATFDRIVVDPRTGRWRFDTNGPSLIDTTEGAATTRPKGKTRRLKGAE